MELGRKVDKNKFSHSESTDASAFIQRETWSRKIEYLLSMIGYCVGLGNIWRFPYICIRNGGGAFLIPFLFFLFTAGLPLYFLEVSIGQFNGKGLLSVWEVSPIFRGLGVGMVLMSVVASLYYNIITAWIIYYIVNSFSNPLPWSTCTNEWNTDSCISDRSSVRNNSNFGNKNYSLVYGDTVTDNTNINNIYNVLDNESLPNTLSYNISAPDKIQVVTSQEEFWQYKVLQMSSGLDDLGYFPWHLSLCFLAAWAIVFFCLMKGVRSVGKVVYVTATLPYIILTVILIRGITLPGGVDGIIYYFKPDFYRLLDIQVWLEAALQVFYSLGPCWGALITMSSYNKFNNNCLRDAVLLTIMSEGTSIYGGMTVFSILGYMALKVDLPIDKVVQSGPGLGFIAYPEAITQLPVSNLWAALFFLMLFTVALDSMFLNVEIIRSSILDTFPKLRKRQALCTCAVCMLFFLLGLPMCTQGGIYIFQLVDWYIAALSVITMGILECLIFGWIYGIGNFSRDVTLMLGRPVPVLLRICICFVTPIILLVTFIFTMSSYKPPNYGSYKYPGYAQIIGWFIACIPLIPFPVYALLEIRKAEGNSIYDKLRVVLRPSSLWQPDREDFDLMSGKEKESELKVPFLRKLKSSILE